MLGQAKAVAGSEAGITARPRSDDEGRRRVGLLKQVFGPIEVLSAARVSLMLGTAAWVVAGSSTQPTDDHAVAPYVVAGPLTEPAIFSKGTISTGDYESHPAFAPDGKTIYFLKDSPDFSYWTIFVSRFQNGRWTKPEIAPFSGQYRDADPFITVDGSKLLFISDRPVPGKAHRDLDIWAMDWNGNEWGPPRNLGAPVNSESAEWYPTMAADGTLYFGSGRTGGQGKTDLWRARLSGGHYTETENLGRPVNSELDEFEPYIATDQSFLIFMAENREGRGDTDLYVTYQRNGAWTKPQSLPGSINSTASEYSPKISPDGKYFFWTSTRNLQNATPSKPLSTEEYLGRIHSAGNGLGDIYQIDFDALHLESRFAIKFMKPSHRQVLAGQCPASTPDMEGKCR